MFLNRTLASPFIAVVDASSVVNSKKNPHRKHGTQTLQIRRGSLIEDLPVSPNPNPEYRMQLLSKFMDLYLPKRNQTPVPGRTPSSWVQQLAHSTLDSSAYNKSLAALCTAHLGKFNRDEVMLNKSVRLYADSLQELRANITSGNIKKDSEAILASIVIMSTYEVRSIWSII